jgi:hypothetical protein
VSEWKGSEWGVVANTVPPLQWVWGGHSLFVCLGCVCEGRLAVSTRTSDAMAIRSSDATLPAPPLFAPVF